MGMTREVKYGYGYYIEEDEINSFTDEKRDAFLENNYCHSIDSWSGNGYFFGIILKELDEGEIYRVPSFDSAFSVNEVKKMKETLKKDYPHLYYTHNIEHYMFYSVN